MTDLYLYQTVHVAHGRARHVARHAALLDEAARTWFGFGYPVRKPLPRSGIRPGRGRARSEGFEATTTFGAEISVVPSGPAEATADGSDRRAGTPRDPVEALRRRIEALARAEHYPTTGSGFVRIELLPEGEERLVATGISLYNGYGYRSLQPSAVTIRYDIPFSEAPTSLHEAASLMARQAARRAKAEAAIRCDEKGRFREVEGAPIFAIAGRTVLAPPDTEPVERVERIITRRAVEAAGLEFREEAFGRSDLKHLDELFFTDHRGITSLSHCDGLPLMIYTAERIAAKLPLTDE